MTALARFWRVIAGDAWGMRCDCWSQWRSRSSKQIIAGHNVEQLLHSCVLSSLRAISICATRAWRSEMSLFRFFVAVWWTQSNSTRPLRQQSAHEHHPSRQHCPMFRRHAKHHCIQSGRVRVCSTDDTTVSQIVATVHCF